MLLFLFALPRNATCLRREDARFIAFTDAETLGSHCKVNSYYNYYMQTPDIPALLGESETVMMHA